MGAEQKGPGDVLASANGLGVTFPSSYSTNLSATIYNDIGSSFENGQHVAATLGVYQCKTAGSDPCAPDLTPGDINFANQTSVTITVPARGGSSQVSFSVPSFSCGRVQVDLGGGGGILGGQIYNMGSNCAEPTPTPPPPTPTPTTPPPAGPPFTCDAISSSPGGSTQVGGNVTVNVAGHTNDGNPMAWIRVYVLPAGQQPHELNSVSCGGGSTTCSGSTTWNTGNFSPGSYTIAQRLINTRGGERNTNTDDPSCNLGYSLTQASTPTPTPTIPTLDVSCSGSPNPVNVSQPVTWTANVSGGRAPYNYSWFGAVSGSTQQVTSQHGSSGTATAYVNVTDSAGGSRRASCQVTVNSVGGPTPTPTPSSISCTSLIPSTTFAQVGQNITLTPNVSTNTNLGRIRLAYFTAPNQEPFGSQTGWADIGIVNSSGQQVNWNTFETLPGSHVVGMVVYNQQDQIVDDWTRNQACRTTVNIGSGQGQPSCTLTASPSTLHSGNNVNLFVSYNPNRTNRTPHNYSFNFGDGQFQNTGNSSSTNHTYTNSGSSTNSFNPSVTVTDSLGVITCSTFVTVLPTRQGSLDLQVQKTPSTQTVNVGEEAIFTIRVTNDSNRHVSGINVIDELPSGLTYSFGSTNGSTNSDPFVSSNQLTWSNISLSSDQQWIVSFRARANVPGSYTNQARARAESRNFGPANAIIIVNQTNNLPTLSLDKVIVLNGQELQSIPASTRRYLSGETVNFRIKVTNTSSTNATNVVLTDNLPAYLDIASAGSGISSGKQITWSFGNMSAGATQTLDYTAIVRLDLPLGEATQSNNARLTASSINPLTDLASIVIFKQPTVGQPNMTIEKTPSTQTVALGAPVTFTIKVHNGSGRILSNIAIFDELPAGFTYQSGSTTGSTTTNPTISGNTLNWPSITLADNQDWTISFRATAPQTSGTFVNQARATAENQNFGPSQATVIVSTTNPITPGIGSTTSPITINNNPTNTNTNNNTITLAAANPAVLGTSITVLPKTGLPFVAWAALGLIPVGFSLRRFGKVIEAFNNPNSIWRDRFSKALNEWSHARKT